MGKVQRMIILGMSLLLLIGHVPSIQGSESVHTPRFALIGGAGGMKGLYLGGVWSKTRSLSFGATVGQDVLRSIFESGAVVWSGQMTLEGTRGPIQDLQAQIVAGVERVRSLQSSTISYYRRAALLVGWEATLTKHWAVFQRVGYGLFSGKEGTEKGIVAEMGIKFLFFLP